MQKPALTTLSVALALGAASGCTFGGEGDGGGVEGDGDGATERVVGTYHVRSQFDLVSGLPGAAGDAVNAFIAMTDDPHDPATWVLDRVVAELDDGTLEALIGLARPGLDELLNDELVDSGPGLVAQLVTLGDAFGQIARTFGTTSTLEVITGAPTVRHHVTELVFSVDGTSFPLDLAELGVPVPPADVAFAPTGQGAYELGDHAFPLSYGALVLVALEQVVLPTIDEDATDLAELLDELIDCDAVGREIADLLEVGSAGLYAGACELGVLAAASQVERELRGLEDDALVLSVAGAARGVDRDGDLEVDLLEGGAWTGRMTYLGVEVPLGESTFRGERVTAP